MRITGGVPASEPGKVIFLEKMVSEFIDRGAYAKAFPGGRGALFAVWILLVSIFAFPVCARERLLPLGLSSQFTVQKWTLDDGLPEGQVCGVVSGADGYLWLVTAHHLVRFDGVSFKSVELPEQAMVGRIEGLFQDSAGGLWLYGYLGVIRYSDGEWWQSEDAGVLRGRVTCVTERFDGKVYFSRESEIYAWNKGELTCVLNVSEFNGGTGLFRQLAFMKDGSLWVVLGDGLYGVEPTGVIRPERETEIRAEWVLQADAAKSILYAHGSFVCLQRGSAAWWRLPDLPTVSVRCLLPRADEELWVGHDGGVDIFCHGRWHTHIQDGIGGPVHVLAMTADNEGNIWLATNTGLMRLRPSVIMSVPVSGADSDEGISSLWVESGDYILVGLNSGGLARGTRKKLTKLSLPSDLQGNVFNALYKESSGKLWCGGLGGSLWMVQKGIYQRVEGVFADGISAIMGDGRRPQWVGTGRGLLAFNEDRNRLEELAWPFDPVLTLWLDKSGFLWVGHESLGLAVLRSGVRDEFLPDTDLPGRTIRAMYRDSDDVLWIGGMSGLSRWEDDRHFVFGREHGLWNESIRQISEDTSGCIWLGTADGIMRISKRELAEVASGKKQVLRVRTFGEEAGLETVSCTGGVFFPLGEPPRDRLWFPTEKGLYTVNTRTLPSSRPAPRVRLVSLEFGESASADNSCKGVPPVVPLTGPGNSRNVSIGYTALDFTTIERVRFRYTLSGPVEQRSALTEERNVHFSRLLPGSYEFKVTACNGDGVWHPFGASVAWTVHPFFWETLWFRLSALLFMCGLVVAVALTFERRRVNRRLKEAQREEELSSERARIARDLHDEIGAKLTRLSLLGTMVAEDVAAEEPLRKDVEEIAGTAREIHRSFDEIVWSVSPRNDAVRSLSNYICKYAEEFFSGSNVACRCQLPEQVPDHPLEPQKRHQVFLAVKEGLNNVLKHADATQVTIQIAFLPEGILRVKVTDNGCGFDMDSADGRGHGLRNMRERIGAVGGSLVMESGDAKGTRLVFEVPV